MRYDESDGEERCFVAGPEDAGARLDHFLVKNLAETSRSFIQHLIDDGMASVNERPAKASLKLKPRDRVRLFLPVPVAFSAEPEDIALNVLHEDADVIVVDKPPRLVVHPSPGHERGTLVNALAHHCRDLSGIGGVLRPGIVHRLDQDTSGCLVVAKNDRAHQSLMDQFQRRGVEKIYLALTAGAPRPIAGRVDARIGRHPNDRRKMAVVSRGGRESLTEYRVREAFGGVSFVECVLHTGRTHQIRVHLRHVGSPVLCDADYGDGRPFTRGRAREAVLSLCRQQDATRRALAAAADGKALNRREFKAFDRAMRAAKGLSEGLVDSLATPSPDASPSTASATPSPKDSSSPVAADDILLARQALHAHRLAFDHPTTRRRLSFEAPLPPDMAAALDALRACRDGGC